LSTIGGSHRVVQVMFAQIAYASFALSGQLGKWSISIGPKGSGVRRAIKKTRDYDKKGPWLNARAYFAVGG
jgi:hypothetical protein